MENIVRGTTPLIKFTFSTIDPEDLAEAYLVIKQNNAAVITKGLSDAAVGTHDISWILTQEETLELADGKPAVICLDWVTVDGTRGIGQSQTVGVTSSAIEEVIL